MGKTALNKSLMNIANVRNRENPTPRRRAGLDGPVRQWNRRLRHSLVGAVCAGAIVVGSTWVHGQEAPSPSVAPAPPQAQPSPQSKTPRPVRNARTSKARAPISPSDAGPVTVSPQAAPTIPARRPIATTPAPQPAAVRPQNTSASSAPQPPRRVVTVVHRMSGWKLLAWLALSGPPALEIDRFPSASDVHTNIVAGFVSSDGRTVVARIPRAEAELETLSLPTQPPAVFAQGNQFSLSGPEFMLVDSEGKRFKAHFVGLDSATGLSLLESEEPLLPSAGDAGEIDDPAVGQRVHMFAPAQVNPPAGDSGHTDGEETIYLDMGRTEGKLVEVKRAVTGRPAMVTARAPLATPALSGAVATTESGAPLGIVALTGPAETRIVPFEDVRAATERVRAVRSLVVPQPWLGLRGDAAFKASLGAWVQRGWKPENAMTLIQNRKGLFVTSVVPETPAFDSGLRPGDVIARVDDHDVNGIEDLTAVLKEAGVGTAVTFTVWRATSTSPFSFPVTLRGASNPTVATLEAELRAARSEVFDVRWEISATKEEARRLRSDVRAIELYSAELAKLEARRRKAEEQLGIAQSRYADAEERVAEARARLFRPNDWSIFAKGTGFATRPLRASGLEVIGLTPRSASRFGARGGVLVVSVIPASAAFRSGLSAGDIIETVAGKTFSHAELRGILRNSTESRISLGVVRGPARLTVLLPLDEREKE